MRPIPIQYLGWVLLASQALLNSSFLYSQEMLSEPRLKLAGPERQMVYLFVRYFDAGKALPTVNMRVRVTSVSEPIPLEFGHEGTRVLIFVPSKQPVTATILDGERVIRQSTAGNQQFAELEVGEVPKRDDYRPPRVALNEEERDWVNTFLTGLAEADTRSQVSDSPNANIQWQTLDAYCQAVHKYLGQVRETSSLLDGWLSWDGNLGSRVVAGNIEFERGVCEFSLVFIEGQLFDVEAASSEMPEDWFDGPASDEQYAETAIKLAELMFSSESDTADQAQEMFAKQYHEKITKERISVLQDGLQASYGSTIDSFELLKTSLAPFDPNDRYRLFSVFHRVHLDGGVECICQTDYDFTSRANQIGRGNLSAFNVRPTWPSAQPEQAEQAKQFFEQLLAGTLAPELFHPEIRKITDFELLKLSLAEAKDLLDGIDSVPSFFSWSADQQGNLTQASSILESSHGPLQVSLSFAGKHLVAAELSTTSAFWDTKRFVQDPAAPGRVAHAFWTRIFSGDFYDAHRYLLEEFQQQLSPKGLEKLVAASDFESDNPATRIAIDEPLISDRLQRNFPAVVTVYLIAQFRDGSKQALRCELLHVEDDWRIIDFSTDFSDQVLIANSSADVVKPLADALVSGDRPELIALLEDEIKPKVEQPILDAFLTQSSATLGDATLNSKRTRIIHEYVRGIRFEHVTAWLEKPEKQIRLNATFKMGRLVLFGVQEASLARFLQNIENKEYFAQRAKAALEQWLKQGEDALEDFLAPQMLEEAERLSRAELKGGWALTFGELESITCQRVPQDAMGVDSSIRVRAQIQFAMGETLLEIEFTYDAFKSQISGLRVLRSDSP